VLPFFYATVCSTVIFTPPVEEFTKVYPLLYRHGETSRSLFIIGFIVGLGFGIAEFFLYVLMFGVPIHVRLPTILLHAATSSISTYGIVIKRPVRFYVVATVLHLLNNFAAIFGPLWLPGGVIIIAINTFTAYFLSWHLYNKTSNKFITY
jgi:RsiW-degrading membrane proteinase PrsW (M82 family)